MKKFFNSLGFLFVIFLFLACTNEEKETDIGNSKIAIVLHGGAGSMKKGFYTPEQEKQYIKTLKQAIETGYSILDKGGSSLDAVEQTIIILENSPLFNAGKGAVLNEEGRAELDASIMNGENKNAGAIGGVRHIKNPITLARKVMENSPHVLLISDGAEKFAKEQGLEFVEEDYFLEINKYSILNKADSIYGTVGCVALDRNGNITAGTSTGGMKNKKFGRLGDSPIIGAGTYADNQTAGVSCTGHGEFFIRYSVAYDVTAQMKYKNQSLKESAENIINGKFKNLKVSGGLIGLDKNGNHVMFFNTEGMFRAFKNNHDSTFAAIY